MARLSAPNQRRQAARWLGHLGRPWRAAGQRCSTGALLHTQDGRRQTAVGEAVGIGGGEVAASVAGRGEGHRTRRAAAGLPYGGQSVESTGVVCQAGSEATSCLTYR